jgi:pimeloyl-ACP methyl ester carboxylesterase
VEPKTTFVLVHGAWRGAWSWKRVAAPLRARGHEVHAPTLTGLAERSHLGCAGVNLSTHVADVVDLLRWEELTDVVLCGHSYAGMVLTGVVARAPERVRGLVLVDAFLPEDGDNLLALLNDEQRRTLAEAAARHGGLCVPPIPAAVFGDDPRDCAWIDAQSTAQPYACMLERIAGRAAVERVARRTYVYAEGPAPTPYTAIHERLKALPGWTLHTLRCGHDVMLERPEALVEILLAAARD